MLKEFKKFLLRGNVVDLAVGVVFGAAFTAVVNALVSDLLTPLMSSLIHAPDFSGFAILINGTKFALGHLINATVSFLLTAFAAFFFIVRPMNKLIALSKERSGESPATKKCPECLSDIPFAAKRCGHCGQVVETTEEKK